MAATVNARDKQLQATSPRVEPAKLPGNVTVPLDQVDGLPEIINATKVIYLRPSAQWFEVAPSGQVNTPAINLNTIIRNMTGTVVWTITDGTATLTDDNGSKSLEYSKMVSDSVTIMATVVDNSGSYFDSTTIVKLKAGTSILNFVLSNESHVISANQNGVVTSLSGAGSTLKVYYGAADVTGSWTFSKVDSVGVSSAIIDGALSVIAMATSVDTGYIDITAKRAGFSDLQRRMLLTKVKGGVIGKDGDRGAGHYYVTGNTWSDVAAIAACPGGPKDGDVVTISNGTTFVMEKIYQNSSWTAQAVVIDGGLIVPKSITSNQINANGLEIRDTQGRLILGAGGKLGTQDLASGAVGLVQMNTATIGTLSALSATIGTLRTAASGGRTEIKDNLISVYDSTNAVRVKLGNLNI